MNDNNTPSNISLKAHMREPIRHEIYIKRFGQREEKPYSFSLQAVPEDDHFKTKIIANRADSTSPNGVDKFEGIVDLDPNMFQKLYVLQCKNEMVLRETEEGGCEIDFEASMRRAATKQTVTQFHLGTNEM